MAKRSVLETGCYPCERLETVRHTVIQTLSEGGRTDGPCVRARRAKARNCPIVNNLSPIDHYRMTCKTANNSIT